MFYAQLISDLMSDLMTEARSILPGEFLGTEEEFVAGDGTYVDDKGGIYAALPGDAIISKDKVVSVKSAVAVPKQLKKGDVVYARVEEIFEPVALLQVAPTATEEVRQNPTDGYSVIHASRVKPAYVEMVHDEFRIGDIVKASVEEIRNDGEIALTTKLPGLGVIKAYCSRCRAPLALRGGKLECGRCGSVEKRHLSKEYCIVK